MQRLDIPRCEQGSVIVSIHHWKDEHFAGLLCTRKNFDIKKSCSAGQIFISEREINRQDYFFHLYTECSTSQDLVLPFPMQAEK
jgi:hypothetical protein